MILINNSSLSRALVLRGTVGDILSAKSFSFFGFFAA